MIVVIVCCDLLGYVLFICLLVFDYVNVVCEWLCFNILFTYLIYIVGLVFKWLFDNGGLKVIE